MSEYISVDAFNPIRSAKIDLGDVVVTLGEVIAEMPKIEIVHGERSDYISRQAAIDAAVEAVDNWDGGTNLTRTDMIEDAIFNAVPTADVRENRIGEWMYGENDYGQDGYYCSKCGNFVPWVYKEYDIDFIKEVHFCPKCGARMDGEQ